MNKTSEAGIPKYQHVLESLQKGILTGSLKPGEKLPGEAGLVKQFGASRITVGRAVRELQRRGLVERRAGSGTFVRPQEEKRPQGQTFGLLIPDLGETEVFEPMCQGIAFATRDGLHGLLWGQSTALKGKAEQAWELCRQYVDRRVAGVFFAPLESEAGASVVNARITNALSEAGIPVVLLDRCVLEYPARSRWDVVGIDNRRAGHLIARHLLGRGRRRVGFLSRPWRVSTVQAREAGYREALFANGAPVEPGLVARLDPEDPKAVAAWLEEAQPDAVVCANDRTAGHLMHSLLTLGRRIPEDVAVGGIDDVEYARLLPVPLTTVRQPCREIGRAAMGAMLDRMAWPEMPARDITLDCELVVRRSGG